MSYWTRDSKIKDWLPRLQSHRGYWTQGLQQNSLESIQASMRIGYEMAEFDVRVTGDGELILFHDDFLENIRISKAHLADLREKSLITTLRELFVWFSKTENFKLNIEIKSKALFWSEIENKVCAMIEELKIESRVLISSFNPLCLYRIKIRNPRIYRALLLTFNKEKGNSWLVTSMIMNVFCRPHILHLRYNDFSARFKELAKEIPVVLWTVNEIDFYRKNKGAIHGVISDSITPQQILQS